MLARLAEVIVKASSQILDLKIADTGKVKKTSSTLAADMLKGGFTRSVDVPGSAANVCFPTQFPIFEKTPAEWVDHIERTLEASLFDDIFSDGQPRSESLPDGSINQATYPMDMDNDIGEEAIREASLAETLAEERIRETMLANMDDVYLLM